jgi:hypothetical protein
LRCSTEHFWLWSVLFLRFALRLSDVHRSALTGLTSHEPHPGYNRASLADFSF